MELPNSININLDVPIEFRASDNYCVYLFNFTYNIVHEAAYTMQDDGTKTYSYFNTFPIQEMSGGLAYYSEGWRVFDIAVQKRYAEYIAEREILSGTNVQS